MVSDSLSARAKWRLIITSSRGCRWERCASLGTKKKYEITLVLKTDIDNDLAIVGVASDDNKIAPAMSVGDSDLTRSGDKVYALANPQIVIGSFEQGSIESIAQPNTWRLSGRLFKGKLFVVTLPVKPGASGGAVLNANGEIIGAVNASD